MGFHVARGHGKIVQTIELHKWREHGHQHDQNEHDFGRFALHSLLTPRKCKRLSPKQLRLKRL